MNVLFNAIPKGGISTCCNATPTGRKQNDNLAQG